MGSLLFVVSRGECEFILHPDKGVALVNRKFRAESAPKKIFVASLHEAITKQAKGEKVTIDAPTWRTLTGVFGEMRVKEQVFKGMIIHQLPNGGRLLEVPGEAPPVEDPAAQIHRVSSPGRYHRQGF